MHRNVILSWLLLALFSRGIVHAQDRQGKMPREDVVEFPAIGEGLCVSNVFQTNMVLQRDKSVTIWGWADPGEKVSVSFAGQTADAAAGPDRSWKATLKAMPANSMPQVMMVEGKDKTLKLENILVGDIWILGGQSNMEFEISKVDFTSGVRGPAGISAKATGKSVRLKPWRNLRQSGMFSGGESTWLPRFRSD
jgi:sialate O-acetylesterase